MARARRGWSRREALGGAVAAATVACAPRREGESAAPVIPGEVDTVVFIMFENRSFDHWLGGRSLEEGKDEDGLVAGMSNPDDNGTEIPVFPMDTPCLDDPPHGWDPSHDSYDGGANDGFVKAYAASSGTDGRNIMGYMRRSDVPISWALADAYTVCERYFCSVMGPTWPNRIYGHAGSNLGVKGNSFPNDYLYTNTTVWKKLSEIGVEWRYYYSDVPFVALFEQQWDSLRCKMIDDLLRDAEAGRLPPVVWIDPAFTYNDNHPPKHQGPGELFLKQVYEALSKSPQWDKMLIVVTYDEHGGFFDHVSPPTTDDDYAEDGFDQMGFRVPTLLIGPWVKAGVCSEVFDHTSWLKYVCDQHGIEPWTRRIAAATSIAAGLDLERMASGIPLEPVELPDYSFDAEDYPPECEGENDVISANLMRFADLARSRGFPVRVDPAAVRAPFLGPRGRPRLG